jgi:hypothetical protein
VQLDKVREEIMTTKTIIIDTLTNEYYCVPMTDKNSAGEPTAGPNDFPYWSKDINEAYDFTPNTHPSTQYTPRMAAENEMKFNDLACDGTRTPQIIEVKQ